LFMVSKEKSKPSSWCIWSTKNLHKWIKNEKLWLPKIGGGVKEENDITLGSLFLNIQNSSGTFFHFF
jgi:hypothetical protein